MLSKESEKPIVSPDVFVSHNEKGTGLFIEVSLPGVNKKDIELTVSSNGFCVKGERQDVRYDSCYQLAHEVKGDKSDASFENGLLKVTVPFKQSLHGKKINIH